MTDLDRERKSFRPSYDRRMSKEMLISADFREKYKDCRSVFKYYCRIMYACITFMLFCTHESLQQMLTQHSAVAKRPAIEVTCMITVLNNVVLIITFYRCHYQK